MGGVCAGDVAADRGSNAGGVCEVEVDIEVDGICSDSGSAAELRIARRWARVKIR